MNQVNSLFDAFGGKKPKQEDPTVQMLYDYEQHYMELVKVYRHEIEFIHQLHTKHEEDVKRFYHDELPEIKRLLDQEPISAETRAEWLKHLEQHISQSFSMSEHFISVLTTKKMEEFNEAIREKTIGNRI